MKLYGETRELLKGTESWRVYEVLLSIIGLICGCFAVSVVVFVRKDFGERYLSWPNLFFGYSVVANFMFLGSMFAVLARWGGQQLMMLFWLAFIVASLYHRWEINRKIKAGVPWHSMYMGTSLLPLPFSEEKIYKFFEPALVFAAGYFLSPLSGQVGVWLMISAFALFICNHIVFYNERRAMLDIRDAGIEAKYYSAAVSGKPASETAGFVVGESTVRLMRAEASLKEAFANLSPELKDVLDTEQGARASAQTAPESR
jgi:hypothetical protein